MPSPLSDASSFSDSNLSDEDSSLVSTPPRMLSEGDSPVGSMPLLACEDDDSPLSTPPLASCAPHRVLLLLSAQRGPLADPADGGIPDAPALRASLSKVLAAARAARPPPLIVHVRHCGEAGEADEKGADGWHLWADVRAGERVLDKRTSSAFAGTALGEWVSPRAELVVVGCSSDFDVRATCRDALRRKNTVLLVRGAHGTYDRPAHLTGGVLMPARYIEREVERSLDDAGAIIMDMSDVTDIFHGR